MRLRGLSLGIVGTLPIFKGRNSRKNETQPAHTDASIQRNKWTSSQTGSKSKNSFLSPQGTPSSLNCKTNLLISEKKPQTQRKCNSFLSPTGYPTQTENKPAYSREKSLQRKENKVPGCAHQSDTLLPSRWRWDSRCFGEFETAGPRTRRGPED